MKINNWILRGSIFLLLLFVSSVNLIGQKHTISGYVSDNETGERLLFTNIVNVQSKKGTTSNSYGYYSLTLPEGEHSIQVSFMGYIAQKVILNLLADTILNFDLQLSSDELEEVVVSGQKNRVMETQMSVIDVSMEKLKSVPVILGESDVLKVMQLMPGVKGGTEGTSGIYVRGGSPEQNLFLLDGVSVYNANHLLGFFSVFNPDALST